MQAKTKKPLEKKLEDSVEAIKTIPFSLQTWSMFYGKPSLFQMELKLIIKYGKISKESKIMKKK